MGSDSRSQLSIAAFALEIAPFLTSEELRRVQQTSWLLRACFKPHTCRPDRARRAQQVVSLILHLDALARDLRSVLQTSSINSQRNVKRSKSGGLRLRDDQVYSLVRDLVLVGLGVRASCLVDTCQLGEGHVHAMIAAFSTDKQWIEYGLDNLSAVQLAGNVFFVNASEFVRLKCLDLVAGLRNVTLINASGELPTPQQISDSTAGGRVIKSGLVDSVQSLMDHVLHQRKTSSTSRGQIVFAPEAACSTALAGLILCYPVVYHIGVSNSAEDYDPFWSTSENCLGHCPLHLFQTSLMLEGNTGERDGDSVRVVLLEFSLPQQLHSDGDLVDARVTPRSIVDQCKRSLERAIVGSRGLSPVVEVSARTLPHVAL